MSDAELRATVDAKLPWLLGTAHAGRRARASCRARVEARPPTPPTIFFAPTRAAALIEAATDDAAIEVAAVGDAAKLINASLPFAGGPVASARPFALGGEGLERSRALLCLT